MIPTNGEGSVERNGSHPQLGYLNAVSPPTDPARAKNRRARRDASISSAVLKSLHQRDPIGQPAPSLGDAAPLPNVNGDPDHPVHKRSRGAGLLPPDVRKRLQADILPQVAPSMMRKGEWATSWTQMFLRLFIYSWTAIRWIAQSLWDKIRGIDSLERRAERLREFIEMLGGSAVKLGQQLSMRI